MLATAISYTTSRAVLVVEELAEEFDVTATAVVEMAILAGVQDFEIDDEPFAADDLAEIWPELDDEEIERITFSLASDEISDKFSWLTGWTA